uniref:Eukaryotic translation initiation factor 4 gamma 1 n=1 Tax=Buteo japonicus TaxID=224669 RepID=A0A8C0BPX0_9AVES
MLAFPRQRGLGAPRALLLLPWKQVMFGGGEGKTPGCTVPPTRVLDPCVSPTQFPAGCPVVPAAPVAATVRLQVFPFSALTRGQIRIRDPNQGGKDITEEIMSGARTSSTPTPPQVRGPPRQLPDWGSGMCTGPLIGELPINAAHLADDRPKPALVVSKPVSLEPSKSASPSPPPPLIPEVEPVVLSAVTLVPMEPPVDADTKVELGEAPPDPHKTFSAITTVPGAAELPLVPAPDMDTVAHEGPVYLPPCWSLRGPGPATAQGGGYRTGHIRVSLLSPTAEQWKPLNPEEKKRYDREFLLGFQFIFASMQKPEGLPQITDVVLDKANKTPLRALDPIRLSGMNCSPDFTPSFANLGRPVMGNRGLPSGLGPRRSQQSQRKEPRKIIATVSLNEDVKLNKAEKAWKPSSKRASEEEDPENIKTQELLRRVRSILNKLTPQMFQQLMKQVMELSIDTEERLKGVIDLVFEKAISEPNFSVAYANMCRCLMGLKVPTTDKPTVTVNFRKLLLNRCQKEFEKDKDDDEIFEKRQKEMDDASAPEEKARMKDELEEARDKARRRSLGNIKFIGELFKLKMLTEAIMHDCVVKLLKNHDEESLECLCRLLTTIGKDLDFEKAKPRMDQYFNQMEKIIKEKKTSSRIRFMLQDVIDLRRNSWVPRRGDQGPKTIDQIHKEAEMEEHREHIKVQQLMSKDKRRGPPGLVADDGWNTVPISKGNRPIDTSRLTKITKPGSIDSNNQLFAPGGRLSWGKGSSGGSGAKPADSGRQNGTGAERPVSWGGAVSWGSGCSLGLCLSQVVPDPCSLLAVKQEPAPPAASPKPALSEEELEKKSKAIIEEYLHINDMKEALQCVQELGSPSSLYIFVQNGIESTLERSTISREHMGVLLCQLVKAGTLSKEQYYKGLREILEIAEDMEIDIPHIWLYLAELITPILQEEGIPMEELFREITKPLLPIGKATTLLVEVLGLLCKGMSQKTAGKLWRDGGLSWKEFLPEDQDVNKFVTEQKLEYTMGESSDTPSRKELTSEELCKQLDKLLKENPNNQRIYDWIEANLSEQQVSSNTFIRALMTSVCHSAINPYRLDALVIRNQAKLLQKYLRDEQKELQALYALQALVVKLDQPPNLLRMFFDALYDEDVIKEEAFYKWESSKDPAEQQGKGVALKSVTAFFTWLREAEDESDNN